MKLQTILAGVDGSRQSIHAASLACRLAEASGGTCHLVHAAAEIQTPTEILGIASGEPSPTQHLKHEARRRIRVKLRKAVPNDVLERLEVEVGRAPKILAEAARRREADLVVVGAKRRAKMIRALAGSVVPYLLRTLDVPVLLATPLDELPNRFLVAADLSDAAEPTIAYGLALAEQLGGTVKVLHVVEPEVMPAGLPLKLDVENLAKYSKMAFEERVRRVAGDVDYTLRRGRAGAEIGEEAADWNADVIVVGSHGRGWVDRLLLGSTAAQLANTLPASVLVVPTAKEALFEGTYTALGATA